MDRHALRVCVVIMAEMFIVVERSAVAQNQFQSHQQIFAIPVSIRHIRDDQYIGSVDAMAPSGIYFQIQVHDFGERIDRLSAKLVDGPSPERTLIELLQAISKGDHDEFVRLSDPDSRDDSSDPVGNSYKTYRILLKDVANPRLVRRLSIGDLDYYELLTQKRFPTIPVVIVQRRGDYYLSWKMMGHAVIQAVSSIVTAHRNEPDRFHPLSNVKFTKSFLLPMPCGDTEKNLVRVLVNARRCNYPIFGDDVTRLFFDREDQELLKFYKASCQAFKTKDFQRYVASFALESRAVEEQRINWRRQNGWLDEYIKSKTQFRKIVCIVSSDELYLLFHQSRPGRSDSVGTTSANFDRIVRTNNGFQRLAKEGPLDSLLQWKPFSRRFVAVVIKGKSTNGQIDDR